MSFFLLNVSSALIIPRLCIDQLLFKAEDLLFLACRVCMWHTHTYTPTHHIYIYILLRFCCCYCFVKLNRMEDWHVPLGKWAPECIFKITYSFGFVFVACAVKTLCRTIWKSISKSMEKKGTKHWEKWCCQQRSREYVADCVCVCVRAIVLNSMMWYSWPSLTQGNEYSAFLIRISYMGEMKHNFNPW